MYITTGRGLKPLSNFLKKQKQHSVTSQLQHFSAVSPIFRQIVNGVHSIEPYNFFFFFFLRETGYYSLPSFLFERSARVEVFLSHFCCVFVALSLGVCCLKNSPLVTVQHVPPPRPKEAANTTLMQESSSSAGGGGAGRHPRDAFVLHQEFLLRQIEGDEIDMSAEQKIRVELQQLDDASSTVTITFSHEDHTVGNPLRHVVMQQPEVITAGYSIPHPLEPRMLLHVQARDYAVDAVAKGLLCLSDICDVALGSFELALKRAKNLGNA